MAKKSWNRKFKQNLSEIYLFTERAELLSADKAFWTDGDCRKAKSSVVSHSIVNDGWICQIVRYSVVNLENHETCSKQEKHCPHNLSNDGSDFTWRWLDQVRQTHNGYFLCKHFYPSSHSHSRDPEEAYSFVFRDGNAHILSHLFQRAMTFSFWFGLAVVCDRKAPNLTRLITWSLDENSCRQDLLWTTQANSKSFLYCVQRTCV